MEQSLRTLTYQTRVLNEHGNTCQLSVVSPSGINQLPALGSQAWKVNKDADKVPVRSLLEKGYLAWCQCQFIFVLNRKE